MRIEKPWQTAGAFFAVSAAVSLHFSPAIGSILGVLSFLCAAVVLVKVGLVPSFVKTALWVFVVLVVWQFGTDALSGKTISWNKWLMRVPLLLIPLSMFWQLSYKSALRCVVIVALPLVWIDLASILNYTLHANFYNQMVLESKPIPVYSIIYHIEFSVYQAVVALSLLHILLQKDNQQVQGLMRSLLLACFVIILVSLHILSARTGMLMFWMGAIGLLWIRFKSVSISKWKVAVIGCCLIISAFIVPSLRNRIINTVEDISSVFYGKDLNHQSFGQRWEAWSIALKAAKEKPLLGYGLDQVHEAMGTYYSAENSHLDELNRINPHNQFLEVAVQSGYIATVLLLATFIWLGIQNYRKQGYQAMSVVVFSIALAMCFESLLERQAGTWVVVLALSGVLFPNNSNK